MGRMAGICEVCGRASAYVYRCGLCGSDACSRCFMDDINVCKRCLRRGLWISDREHE